nr:transposase [Halocella sp. SP3-1]
MVEINKTPLSKMMQGIQQVFTMKYNKKYNRTGHVFEQRYKAMLCNKDKYLFNLLRYIHQNPVRAGIEEKLNYKME